MDCFEVRGRRVHVKREDLYGIPPAPPLGKLRGLRRLLRRLHGEGFRLVGTWDTRISRLGEGVAAAVHEWEGLRCIVSYPHAKGSETPEPVRRAADLGAEVFPAPAGRITVSFARAREHVTACGGVMLPFGLECLDAVEGVEEEAATVPQELVEGGTLVLCCGSGVTLAGLLRGLPAQPRRILALSSGRSLPKIEACLRRYAGPPPAELEILPAAVPYSLALDIPCPFPTHPHYDLKAWGLLEERLPELPDPVLFWNIGA
ncbi:MAG TPA: hypothetical protein VH394_08845 [Thermoanaerobaculia bacterium]|nr:hypothetical protein [Thermoanaerobaculia bacterium]